MEEKLANRYAIGIPLRVLERWIVVCDFDGDGFELVMRQCVALKLLSCLTGKAGLTPQSYAPPLGPQATIPAIEAEPCTPCKWE
jgi:hypothetical protein